MQALSDGFQGFYTGLLAVVATLQLRFAQVLTLGASLGDRLHTYAKQFEPTLQESVDPDMRRWIPQISMYVCKSLGVSLAWMMQRVIFGFTSATKGASMATQGLRDYLVKMKFIDEARLPAGDPTLTYIEVVLAGLGFYAQFCRGFSGLGYAAIILFPLSVFEWTLGLFLGSVV